MLYMNKMKKISIPLMVLFFLLLSVSNVWAGNNITIIIDEKVFEFNASYIYKSTETYLPLNFLCKELNSKAGFDSEQNILIVRNNYDTNLDINKAATKNQTLKTIVLEVNGTQIPGIKIFKINDDFFVPLYMIEFLLEVKIYNDKENMTIVINSKNQTSNAYKLLNKAITNTINASKYNIKFKGLKRLGVESKNIIGSSNLVINASGSVAPNEIYLKTLMKPMKSFIKPYKSEKYDLIGTEIYIKGNNIYVRGDTSDLWFGETMEPVNGDIGFLQDLLLVNEKLRKLIQNLDNDINFNIIYKGTNVVNGQKNHIVEIDLDGLKVIESFRESAKANSIFSEELTINYFKEFDIKYTFLIGYNNKKINESRIQVNAIAENEEDQKVGQLILTEEIKNEYDYIHKVQFPLITDSIIEGNKSI